MLEYVIVYAKITEDKQSGLALQGVYFGGSSPEYSEAENLARQCVNSIKGGTILPKVLQVAEEQLIEALYDATDTFERTLDQMKEVDRTIRRSQRRR